MNTLYFKYALEVEKTASITQAADNLYMTQPTMSKAIKELETGLGFPVFRRTAKGVVPTQKGREFLLHARNIVSQIEKMETALKTRNTGIGVFSLALPHVSYISQAVAGFICSLDNIGKMELNILETGSQKVKDLVEEGKFAIGIIRCPVETAGYILENLEDRGMRYRELWQSRDVVLMQKNHPLAQKPELNAADFAPYIEIAFGDEAFPHHMPIHSNGDVSNGKKILIYERAMQFDLLQTDPLTYIWSPRLPKTALEQYGLVQRECKDSPEFKDILISRTEYRYSDTDRAFLCELERKRKEAGYTDE